MITKSHIFFLLACLFSFCSFSQNYSAIEFVENKGQWDSGILYKADVPAGSVYIHRTGFTIVQHNPDDWQNVYELLHDHKHKDASAIKSARPALLVRSHSFRVSFLNAASNPQIIADKPLETYNNYFIGNDPSKWAEGCKTYQGITIKNLYPDVDIRYYTQNGQIKYDLIASPGADISKIALKYDGVDKLEVKNKELNIGTSVGTLKELSPYTYQHTDKGRKTINNRYLVKNNIVRFDVKNFDSKSPLVIDPTLIFCSFSGSRADNWGFTATYGPDGSMFGGGVVFSNGFPTSPGAFQSTHSGGSGDFPVDIGIIKLTPNGTNRVYATYIGGKGSEQPHSLVVDGQGNLIIAGRTNSSDYPTRGGTGVLGSGGGYDIVVTKLNATGSDLIGSKRIGGSGNDGVNINPSRNGASSLQQNYGDDGRSEVILDGAGNIYVASATQSSATDANRFPVTSGAFQQSFGGGTQDGVLLKLPPDVSSLTFASFLGGSGNDAAYVLALHPFTNEIYVAGGTESTQSSFPMGAGGGVYPIHQGSIDGFVSIINNSGTQLIRSTFLGTTAIDQVYGVQFDKFGFPYVMGQTRGAWPTMNAKWVQAGGKQFIAKLEQNLSGFVYSTTFGTGSAEPNISPVAFLVDRCENVYVSGWGGNKGLGSYGSAGTIGMFVTPDAIRGSTDGNDFYYLVLKRNADSPLYATFHGKDGGDLADHVDGGTSRFDRNGVIYQAMCADCDPNVGRFPTTPGVWSRNNPSDKCNLAMVKIFFNFSGVRSGIQSSINGVARDSVGCVPLTVNFTDTVRNAVSYEWNFGDGSPQITTQSPDTSHTYNNVGVYRVMLVAIDSTTCNIRDTSYMNIRVGNLEATLDFNFRKRPGTQCDLFRYDFFNLSVAPASRPFNDSSFVWDFGDGTPLVRSGAGTVPHDYVSPGVYNVKLMLVDTGYCNAPDVLDTVIRIAARVKARFETPAVGCAPYTATFTNISDAGQQFFWNFGDGTTSTAVSPVHFYALPGTYTVSLLAVDSSTCNISDSTRMQITISGKPTADFTASPQPPIENVPITFTSQSSSDVVRYEWHFGDGDSLVTNSPLPVSHEYNTTDTYDACLIVYNASGCSDTICKPVQTLVVVSVDVPNAFTPASSDGNNRIFVRGYGFAKMKFIIWNRWGQKVFETSDKRIGWDGKFNGVLQPMDVYAYTLEVEFTDGTRASKKGDITLIR